MRQKLLLKYFLTTEITSLEERISLYIEIHD